MRFSQLLAGLFLSPSLLLSACGSSDSSTPDQSGSPTGTGGTSSQGGSSAGPGGSSATGGSAGKGTGGGAGGSGGATTGTGGKGGSGPGTGGSAGSSTGPGGSAGTSTGVGGQAAGGNGTGGNGTGGDAVGGNGTGGTGTGGSGTGGGAPGGAIQTVFLIVMENHNWSDIKGSSSAPYINSLLALGAHAEQYKCPKNNHPSEPNYLWLEAGQNFGIQDDLPPSINHQSTTEHLSTQLDAVGISWRSYQQGMVDGTCPLTSKNEYAPKHNPFVFFDDATGTNNAKDPYCIAHNVEIKNLETDLAAGSAARYNFITPDLCHDMHDSCAPQNDPIKQGDDYLATIIPMIQGSAQYQNGGAIFITWDENEGGDFPVGMIVLSPLAKPAGYSNSIPYTHSSTLRTMETIFGASPFLADAANATDLSDLFATFPLAVSALRTTTSRQGRLAATNGEP